MRDAVAHLRDRTRRDPDRIDSDECQEACGYLSMHLNHDTRGLCADRCSEVGCLACKVLGSDLAGGPEVQYQIRTGAFTVGALVYLHCAGSSSGISYVLKFAPLTEHDRSINRQANQVFGIGNQQGFLLVNDRHIRDRFFHLVILRNRRARLLIHRYNTKRFFELKFAFAPIVEVTAEPTVKPSRPSSSLSASAASADKANSRSTRR